MGFLDSIKKGFAMEDEDRPIPNTLDELVRTSGSSEAGRGRVIVVEPMRMEECNALVECIRHGLVVIINTEKLEEEFSRRSVRSDIEPSASLPQLDKLSMVDYDAAWASRERGNILKSWQSFLPLEETP